MLLRAARACGALSVQHTAPAIAHYVACLSSLRSVLTGSESDFSLQSSTEACVTILMLINFELMKSGLGADLDAHLGGLTTLLKQHARYYMIHGKDEHVRYISYKPGTCGMVYQAYRSIECLLAVRRMSTPLMSFEEYEVLLSMSDCETREEQDAIVFWRIMHDCASTFAYSDPVRYTSLVEIQKQIKFFSWSGVQTIEEKAPSAVPIAGSMIHTLCHIDGEDDMQVNRRTSIQTVVDVSILRVACSLTAHRPRVEELLSSSNDIAMKLAFLLSRPGCNSGWLAFVEICMHDANQHLDAMLREAGGPQQTVSP